MKIVIPGGSGQVGTMLARAFHQEGCEVVVLSRQAAEINHEGAKTRTGKAVPWKVVAWDGANHGPWWAEIDNADVVINLAGRSVNCRYNAANREEILRSRVESTRAVGAAIAAASKPPRVWLQASTATIYAHRFEAANDEATGIIGGEEPDAPEKWRFSIEVARAWEQAAEEAITLRTRKVLLRSAMTMSPDRGGIFSTLLTLVRCALSGSVGDGRQYVSWIHEQDFVRAVRWLIQREDLSGPVNLAAPNPLPYAEFMRILRRASGHFIGLPATEWMVEIGTRLLCTESELVLKSRRVVPARLLDSGFTFRFPTWPEAARDLYLQTKRRPSAHDHSATAQ